MDDLKKKAEAAQAAREAYGADHNYRNATAAQDASEALMAACTPDAILNLYRERNEAVAARETDWKILEGSPEEAMARLWAAQASITTKDKEIARLREALAPFAKAAEVKLCGDWRDDEPFGHTDVTFHLTFGDLRRARAAATQDMAKQTAGENRCDCGHTIDDCATRPGLRHCEKASGEAVG